MKTMKFCSILAVLVFATVAFSQDLEDPATLHTGTPGCPAGCAGDPNQVTGNTFDISQTSGGAGALNVPFLLILGVPNATNPALFSDGSINSVTSSSGGTTSWCYSTCASGFHGFLGSMTTGDVYHQSFFSPPGSGIDASNSFGNWQGADSTINHINATSFGIYVFQITATLSANGTVTFNFNPGALPKGTFIVGYGDDGKNAYVNPFTEAGLGTGGQTPEPTSLALLGAGLVSIGAMARRRSFAKN